ncbi:MAG: cadmium resistance transporter [Actinomycetaceae bacterium]|nr:cadmium resistance transporter [Actinomycetaceae bacterium]
MFLTVLKAIGLFIATNVDHLVVLSLFFAHGAGRKHTLRRIFVGQYIGFGAILALTIAVAVGSRQLLPEGALPWFGLIPLAIGIRAGIVNFRERREEGGESELEEAAEKISKKPLSILAVAGVTFANGGDEIGAYVPVFALTETAEILTYVIVFLIGVAGVVFLAKYLTSRPKIAEVLDEYEELLFPLVLILLGLGIIIFGLI